MQSYKTAETQNEGEIQPQKYDKTIWTWTYKQMAWGKVIVG